METGTLNNSTDQPTIQDIFNSPGLTVAVLFVDEQGNSHLTPDCDKVVGATTVVTNYDDRGSYVCSCIPLPPKHTVPQALQQSASSIGTTHSPSSTSAHHGGSLQRSWPSDLDQLDPSALSLVNFPNQDFIIWLGNTKRKLTPEDVEAIQELKAIATKYVMDEANKPENKDNDFIISVANACARYDISPGQAKGVLNWWRSQIQRSQRNNPAPKNDNPTSSVVPSDEGAAIDLDLSNVPDGTYLVERVIMKVNKPTNNRWAGWAFINGEQRGDKIGNQRPGAFYKGQYADLVAKLISDPLKYAKAYGIETGQCGNCGRTLTNPESIAKGIGPICEGRY